MNIILLLQTLLILLFGTKENVPKHDLRKTPTKNDYNKILNCWIQRNFYILALITIIICLIGFVIVCFMIVGVSATESGTLYNHMGGMI